MFKKTVTLVLYVYIISLLCMHFVNMVQSQLDSSRIERQSLLEKLDNETELFDECDYMDLTESNLIEIKECDLNIIHLNIRGIISKQSQLTNLLHTCIGKHLIHIATINETWLTKDNEHLLNIPDYQVIKRNRIGKKGGGVCILVHKSLYYNELNTINNLQFKHIEQISIELKVQRKNLLVSSLYRPPNTNVTEFNEEYENLLRKMQATKLDIVIGLDHNLDLLKIENHKPTQDFFNINIDNQLFPTITKPTRITANTATLLDNLLVSLALNQNYTSGILVEDISDHQPCILILKERKFEQKEPTRITTRSMSEKDIAQINEDLTHIPWEAVLNSDSADENFNRFHKLLSKSVEENTTIKNLTIPYKQRLKEPWMTKGIKKCITKKLQLYKQTLKKSCTEHMRQKYIEYRNTLKKTMRHAKMTYYNNKCLESKRNTKKLWNLINEIIGTKKKSETKIDAIKVDNILRHNPKVITNELGKYFANVGKTYANKVPQSITTTNEYINKIPNNSKSLFFGPVVPNEIENIINTLEPKKSSGHDGISNKLIKQISKSISLPLTIIFNQSLETGVFPTLMKYADITPLYKTKCKYETTNYRPISLLLTISKILEKVVYKRTYQFLEDNHIIFNSQYGFRRQHSCQDAISELVGKILKNMEEQKYTIAVFIDLSKAFDTLEHEVLFAKLEKYGIRGTTLNWYKSYLTNRKLRVKCKIGTTGQMEYSEYYDVKYGTPQGSCLGPLLFLIFNNDLNNCLENSSSILFADDTTIYDQNKNLNFLKWNLEQELLRVVDWFNANKLTLNVDKTQCLLFEPKTVKTSAHLMKKDNTCSLRLENTELKFCKSVKFLGTWIDHQLNWNHQFQNIIYKVQKNRILLQISQNHLPIHTKILVYYAHIYSHINYCIRIWGNMISRTQLNQLQKEQNKCIRLIEPNSNTPNIYKKHKLATIDQIIQIENCKLGFCIDRKQVPKALYRVITEDSKGQTLMKTHGYLTRNKNMPNLPRAKSMKYQSSFLSKGIKEFNKLPQEFKDVKSWPMFKSKIKAHFIK